MKNLEESTVQTLTKAFATYMMANQITEAVVDFASGENLLDRVRYGKQVPLVELLDEINRHCRTSVSLMDTGKVLLDLEVNRCDEYNGGYTLSKDVADDYFRLEEGDVVEFNAHVSEDGELMLIDCTLNDGKHLKLVIFNINTEVTVTDECETGIYDLEEILQEDIVHVIMTMTNQNGFRLSLEADEVILMENKYGYNLMLIQDEDALLTIPIYDDSSNYIYIEGRSFGYGLTIKPYGMPFTEIRMAIAVE